MGIAQVAASSRQGVHKANAYCPSASESRTFQAAIKIGNEKSKSASVERFRSYVHLDGKRAFRGSREASFIYACARDLGKRGRELAVTVWDSNQ